MKIPESVQALRAGAPPNLAEMVSDEGMRQNLGLDNVVALPDAAPVKGTTWGGPTFIRKSAIGTMTGRVKCTYQGPEARDGRQLEKITLRAPVTFAPDSSAPGLLTIKSQSTEGYAYFDREAGRGIESSTRFEMEAEINAGADPLTLRFTVSSVVRLVK